MLICKKCNESNFIKKGVVRNKQTYKCKECGSRAFPIDTEYDEEILQSNVDLAKKNQALLDSNRIERKSFREFARVENAVSEYVKELKNVLQNKSFDTSIKHETTNPNCLIVHLTDSHFNELVHMIGNTYDFKVAAKRLCKFANRISLYSKIHNINNVYLVMSGDLLNSDRRLDELLSNATNRANATMLSVKLLSQFINDINKFANVNIISVSGNESRINKEYGYTEAMVTDNFDFMIYEILKLLFVNNEGVNFISGNTSEYVIKINGTTFLIVHGTSLKAMHTNDIAKAIRKWVPRGVGIDYIICGHLHETKITDTLLRGGSLVGNNAYADHGLNLNSKASQNLHLIYEDGSVDSIKIDLQYAGENSYEIDDDLNAYNAKSVDKIKPKTKVFEVVI